MLLNENFLWNNFKVLKKHADIFIDIMDLELNKTPNKYVVLERFVYDSPYNFGDGETLLRRNDFNIRIIASTLKELHLILTEYKNRLKELKFPYNQFSPVPDPQTGKYSVLITSSYVYS